MNARIQTYEEFWPYYVSQHMDATCRILHFVGTSLVLACFTSGLLISPLFFAAMPVAGYGFAWVGHFIFEKNRPATFTYPQWSFKSDFVMLKLFYTGKLKAELAKYNITWPASA
jgi:hypothetical protein